MDVALRPLVVKRITEFACISPDRDVGCGWVEIDEHTTEDPSFPKAMTWELIYTAATLSIGPLG